MTNPLKLFLQLIAALFRQNFSFEDQVDREIYMRIFPHVTNERNHGYPFRSTDELGATLRHESLAIRNAIDALEKQCDEMPKVYGRAFRYIMYRDISRCLAKYQAAAPQHIYPKTCDPRFVATRA